MNESSVSDLESKPLTVIANSNVNYLVEDFWSENLSKYIEVFLKGNSSQKAYIEDEAIYVRALNELSQFDSLIERLIDHVSTKVQDIDNINNLDTKKYLIGLSKVEHTWCNVFKYFSSLYYDEEGRVCFIDNALIDFLENGVESLQKVKYSELDELEIENWDDVKFEFEQCLFKCNELNDDTYEQLIGAISTRWNHLHLDNLNEAKVLALIDLGKLCLTTENWEQIKEYTSVKVAESFLVHHHEDIINDLDLIQLRAEDIYILIHSNEVSIEYKKLLIENEIFNLVDTNEDLRKKVIDLYESEQIPDIVYEKFKSQFNDSEIRYLLLNHIEYLGKSRIVELIGLMDEPYQTLVTGQEVEFLNTAENIELLTKLNNFRIVTSITDHKKTKLGLPRKAKIVSRLQNHVLKDI